MRHSVYQLHRIPSGDQQKCACHTIPGRKPDLSLVRLWGCVCYCHLDYDQRAPPGDAPVHESGQRPKKLATRADELVS
jgi:hypothetical protein